MKQRVLLAALAVSLAVFVTAVGSGGSNDRLKDFRVKIPKREFSYFVGDVIKMEVEIAVTKDFSLDERILPSGRIKINDWLELSLVITPIKKETDENRYRLRYEYQIFFVPKGAVNLQIPEYPLKFRSQENSFAVLVPPYDFVISPLSGDKERKEFQISSDWEPAGPNAFWLKIAGAVSVLLAKTVLVWIFAVPFLKAFYDRRRSVFRLAVKSLKKAGNKESAFTIVHRALNAYAGKTCFSHNLNEFFSEHPDFLEARAELEGLFDCSDKFFFTEKEQREESGLPELIRRLESLLKSLHKLSGRARSRAARQDKERRRER